MICELQGQQIRAFLPFCNKRMPSPTGLYKVLLQPISNPKTCTYRVVSAQLGVWQNVFPVAVGSANFCNWYLCTTLYNNTIVKNFLLSRDVHSPLTHDVLLSQQTHGNFRFDFKLILQDQSERYVEVKSSFLLFNNFIKSPRMYQHLSQLNNLPGSIVLFLSHLPGSHMTPVQQQYLIQLSSQYSAIDFYYCTCYSVVYDTVLKVYLDACYSIKDF